MNISEILVCVVNHNYNENAKVLKDNLSKYFETIIIDSKSNIIEEFFDIKLENVYYTGLVNESIKQCKLRDKKYLFFIASDVYYNENIEKIADILSNLDDDIYLWGPSSRGQSHIHCKNKGTEGLRDVPYLEGFTFLVKVEVCDMIYPIDEDTNRFGFGIDLLLGYNTIRNFKKRCVVDDRYEVYHTEGTGYDSNKALQDMYTWMGYGFNRDVQTYTMLYSTAPGDVKLLEFLKQ